MFSQNHQPGPNARLNGSTAAGQRMAMLYNYQQQQGPLQHQSHSQHQQPMQPDHSGHIGNGSMLAHPSSYSSAGLQSASPFSAAIQNGHSLTRGGQALVISDHWAEQLRLHKEAERAHTAMAEQHQPHFWARTKAGENRGIAAPSPKAAKAALTADGEGAGRRQPWRVDTPTIRQDWYSMDLSGQGFRTLAPQVCRYDFLQELYIASNKLNGLPAVIGQLRQLRHLDASFNNIGNLPPEIGMCTYLKTLLLFDNRLTDLPSEIGSLHLLETLGIEGNPIRSSYRQEIMERGTKSLISYLRETSQVPPPPPLRKFVTVQEDVSASLERIKVFSWNVLCDKYATPQAYGYTPTNALSWNYRRDCIMDEIRIRDADFLCLQEISNEGFRDDFCPELAKQDYKGVHWPKSRARTMTEKDALVVDGCAVFYKGSKYLLLDKQLIEFATIAINRPDMKHQHDVFNRVMPQDNIAVICFFECRQSGARIILVNVHLTWASALADVKVIQTGILMEHVTKLAEKYARWPPLMDKKPVLVPALTPTDDRSDDRPTPPLPQQRVEPHPSQDYRNNIDIPLLVCGDFNSTGDSSVYELMSMGRVPPDHLDLTDHQYGSFTKDGIEHPFSLRDAYAHLKGTADELPFTNYTPGFVDVIDYFWYSTNTLEVVSLLGPPDAQYLKRVPAFPFYHFPADHIQIMAEFVIKARKDKKLLPEPDFGPGTGGGADRRT